MTARATKRGRAGNYTKRKINPPQIADFSTLPKNTIFGIHKGKTCIFQRFERLRANSCQLTIASI